MTTTWRDAEDSEEGLWVEDSDSGDDGMRDMRFDRFPELPEVLSAGIYLTAILAGRQDHGRGSFNPSEKSSTGN